MSVKASQLTCVPHVSDVQTRSSELSPPDSCLVVLCSGDIVRVTSVDTADGASPNTGKLSNLVIVKFDSLVLRSQLWFDQKNTPLCYVLTDTSRLYAVPITPISQQAEMKAAEVLRLNASQDQIVLSSKENVTEFLVTPFAIVTTDISGEIVTVSIHSKGLSDEMFASHSPSECRFCVPIYPAVSSAHSDFCSRHLYCIYPNKCDNSTGCFNLERRLFCHLFGEETYLHRSPVILFVQSGGHVLWLPMKGSQIGSNDWCLLLDLTDTPVSVHTFFLLDGKQPQVDYPANTLTANCLVFTGYSGKLSVYSTHVGDGIQYSEHHIPGPVHTTTQNGPNLIYSTGRQIKSINIANLLPEKNERSEPNTKTCTFVNANFLQSLPSLENKSVVGSPLRHIMLAVSSKRLYLLHVNWEDTLAHVHDESGPEAVKDALSSIHNTSKILQSTHNILSQQQHCLSQLGLANAIIKSTRNIDNCDNKDTRKEAPVTATVNVAPSTSVEGVIDLCISLCNNSCVVIYGWNMVISISSRTYHTISEASSQARNSTSTKTMESHVAELQPGETLMFKFQVEIVNLIAECPAAASICLIVPVFSDTKGADQKIVTVPLPVHHIGVLSFLVPHWDDNLPALHRRRQGHFENDLQQLQKLRSVADESSSKQHTQSHTANLKLNRKESRRLATFLQHLLSNWKRTALGMTGESENLSSGQRISFSGGGDLKVSVCFTSLGGSESEVTLQTSSPALLLLTWQHILLISHVINNQEGEEFSQLHIGNLKSLKRQIEQTEESVLAGDTQVMATLFTLYLKLRNISSK